MTMNTMRTAYAALLIAAAFAAGCGGVAAKEQGGEVAVQLVAPLDTVIARPVVGSGALASKEETPLSFTIGGVVGFMVEEGARVAAGTRLATLEGAEVEASVAKTEAAAAKADRDLARAKALFADSVVSKQLYDDAETGARVAANDLRIARFHRTHAQVVAPVAGVVLRRLAEPGQTVSAGASVILFGAAGKGAVVHLGVPDRDFVRLAVGDAAVLTFDTHPGQAFAAHVARLGAAAAPGAGTYDVELHPDTPLPVDFGPTSGLVADVRITPAQRAHVLLLPIEVLLEGDGDKGFVWALDAHEHPQRREVQVAFVDGDRVAIASGLEGATRVVAGGSAFLTSTTRVRVAGR